jgi:two-component system response regulator DegU
MTTAYPRSAEAMYKTVLIADESQLQRDIVKDSLSMWAGIDDFEEAADGKEVIERVMAHKPDLIILDLQMPNMNGLEAARILKSVAPEVPLLLFTMHDLPSGKASQFGFASVVTKDQGFHRLADCVLSLLHRHNGPGDNHLRSPKEEK